MTKPGQALRDFYSKYGDNRFVALEEVQTLLGSRGVDWKCLFDVLYKSDDGIVEFCIGDISVQFTRGFGVWSGRRDVIQMIIELQTEKMDKTVGYEYQMKELQIAGKTRCASQSNQPKPRMRKGFD